jgi:hypothetical protein
MILQAAHRAVKLLYNQQACHFVRERERGQRPLLFRAAPDVGAQSAIASYDKGEASWIVGQMFTEELSELWSGPGLPFDIEDHNPVFGIKRRKDSLFLFGHLPFVIARARIANLRDFRGHEAAKPLQEIVDH